MRSLFMSIAICFLLACGGTDRAPNNNNGGGNNGGGGAPAECENLGDAIELDPSVRPHVIQAPGGLLLSTTSGGELATRLVTQTGVDDAVEVGMTREVTLVGSSSVAYAVRIPGSIFVDGFFVRRWDGASWIATMAPPTGALGPSGLVRARAVAMSADNQLAVLWTINGVIHYALWSETQGLEATGEIPGVSFETPELHASYGSDGRLHVLATVQGANGLDLALVSAQGTTWGAPITVTDAPGIAQNITVSGLGTLGDTPFAAQIFGSTLGTPGALRTFSVGADGPTALSAPAVDRIVATGLDLTTRGNEAFISAAFGANNLDAANSEDSVELYRCDGSGCRRASTVQPARGFFYDATSIAFADAFGLVVYEQAPKGGVTGPERTAAQRVTCR